VREVVLLASGKQLPVGGKTMAATTKLDARRQSAAKNQSLFREVNERIEDLASGVFVSFICECADPKCDEQVSLTIEEYERIRSNPVWFFVLAGHVVPEIETLVQAADRYVVVKKIGAGERVAEKLDPRSRKDDADST
jgi:hypothetical protein